MDLDSSPYADAARGVAKFLDSQLLPGESSLAWQRASGPEAREPVHTLYHGTAGIIVFYLELYQLTADDDHLATATRAGETLIEYLTNTLVAGTGLTVGLYSGWPGYVFVLNELFKATGDQRFQALARRCRDQMVAQASPVGNGLGWIEDLPFSDITGVTGQGEVVDLSIGAAGAGVLELYAFREGLTDSLDVALAIGDRLLELGEQVDGGVRWLMMAEMPFAFTAPNFAHGPAGTAYFLAELHRLSGEVRFLDAAKGGASYVMKRQSPQSDGFLVCHNEEEQPASLFYLGVCHGPPGTGRLMHVLHDLTGDPTYRAWLVDNFAGLVSTGAPEQRSAGLWQNVGQCCGDAGIGDYALYLYHATGERLYLDYAVTVADHIITQAEQAGTRDPDGAMSWNTAEHRSRPRFVESQTGYMQGAAGVGSFLVHIASVLDGEAIKIVLPETPFYGTRQADRAEA